MCTCEEEIEIGYTWGCLKQRLARHGEFGCRGAMGGWKVEMMGARRETDRARSRKRGGLVVQRDLVSRGTQNDGDNC